MNTQDLAVFIAIILLLLTAGVVIEQGYEENLDSVDVTNETINVSAFDTPLSLDNSSINGARYDETITAWNSSDGQLTATTDYVWHDGNGTIEFVSGSPNVSLGENALVTYGYDDPSTLQVGVLQLFEGWLPGFVLVIAVLTVILVKDHL